MEIWSPGAATPPAPSAHLMGSLASGQESQRECPEPGTETGVGAFRRALCPLYHFPLQPSGARGQRSALMLADAGGTAGFYKEGRNLIPPIGIDHLCLSMR